MVGGIALGVEERGTHVERAERVLRPVFGSGLCELVLGSLTMLVVQRVSGRSDVITACHPCGTRAILVATGEGVVRLCGSVRLTV